MSNEHCLMLQANIICLTKRGASETLISTQAAMALVGYFVLR